QDLELHARQLAILDDEALRRVVLDDLDAFFFGVFELPRRRLEVFARAASHHLHVLPAEPLGGTAAVHGGVADADDQDFFADLVDVAEVDAGEPLDTDVDAIALVAA